MRMRGGMLVMPVRFVLRSPLTREPIAVNVPRAVPVRSCHRFVRMRKGRRLQNGVRDNEQQG